MLERILFNDEPYLKYDKYSFTNEYDKLKIGDKVEQIGKTGKWPHRVDLFPTFLTYKGTLKIEDELFLVFEIPADQVLFSGGKANFKVAKLYAVSESFLSVPSFEQRTARFYLEEFLIIEEPEFISLYHKISDTLLNKGSWNEIHTHQCVFKLDRNFHIYVHGDKSNFEEGKDSKGNFFKLYYINKNDKG